MSWKAELHDYNTRATKMYEANFSEFTDTVGVRLVPNGYEM